MSQRGNQMMDNAVQLQIGVYAKLLKVPTFDKYPEVLKTAGQDADFGTLLLALMRREYEHRQENQNNRRLKLASFPFTNINSVEAAPL